MAKSPIILEDIPTTGVLAAYSPIYDRPNADAEIIRTSPNTPTVHTIVCDTPLWTGIELKVGDVPVLGFVQPSTISQRVSVTPASTAFDTFVKSMVAEIVPLVKDAIDGK